MRLTLPALAATIVLAAPDALRAQGAGAGPVAEIVTFRLVPGTDEAAFLDAARGTEVAVRAQPGFVARRLSKDEAGLWTDMVEWQSLASAEAAARAVMAEPAFGPFAAMIDMDNLTMRHAPILFRMD